MLIHARSKDQNLCTCNLSQKWQKVFRFVKVCIGVTLVHENSRKKQVFGEFLKFFTLSFLVCQRGLSTYVNSRKITDIVVFSSFFFHRYS